MNRLRDKYLRAPFAERAFWMVILFAVIVVLQLYTLQQFS
jgi:hypothetical protein